MTTRRRIKGWSTAVVALAAASWSPAAVRAAEPPFAGNISVVVPATPRDLQLTLTVNKQRHDNATIDGEVAGTLVVGWSASRAAPAVAVDPCPGSGPGARILLLPATGPISVWGAWSSAKRTVRIGPVDASSVSSGVMIDACPGEPSNEDDPSPPETDQREPSDREDTRGRGREGHPHGRATGRDKEKGTPRSGDAVPQAS